MVAQSKKRLNASLEVRNYTNLGIHLVILKLFYAPLDFGKVNSEDDPLNG